MKLKNHNTIVKANSLGEDILIAKFDMIPSEHIGNGKHGEMPIESLQLIRTWLVLKSKKLLYGMNENTAVAGLNPATAVFYFHPLRLNLIFKCFISINHLNSLLWDVLSFL